MRGELTLFPRGAWEQSSTVPQRIHRWYCNTPRSLPWYGSVHRLVLLELSQGVQELRAITVVGAQSFVAYVPGASPVTQHAQLRKALCTSL